MGRRKKVVIPVGPFDEFNLEFKDKNFMIRYQLDNKGLKFKPHTIEKLETHRKQLDALCSAGIINEAARNRGRVEIVKKVFQHTQEMKELFSIE